MDRKTKFLSPRQAKVRIGVMRWRSFSFTPLHYFLPHQRPCRNLRRKNSTTSKNNQPCDAVSMINCSEKKGERMAYRYGEREQLGLLPASIEDYVSKEDPVRVYDAFVESLNFAELGIEIDEDQVGNPEYDPKAMMKLLVYG